MFLKKILVDAVPKGNDMIVLPYLGPLSDKNQKLDYVIVIDVPDNLIITRLSSRRSCKKCGQVYNLIFEPPDIAGKCNKCNGALFMREDDIPDTIQQRLNIYHQQTEPVIKYYIKNRIAEIIDSQGSIEQIKTIIIERITAYKN